MKNISITNISCNREQLSFPHEIKNKIKISTTSASTQYCITLQKGLSYTTWQGKKRRKLGEKWSSITCEIFVNRENPKYY